MTLNHERDSVAPFVVRLKACGRKKDLCEVTRIHGDILRRGLLEKSPHIASTLIRMYTECGDLCMSRRVFEELLVRDVVTWNSLISCYIRRGQGLEALKCFGSMLEEGLHPTEVTFLYVLKACGEIGDIGTAEQIHKCIVARGVLEKSIMLGNALVDMYAKCGMLKKAREALEHLPIRDIVSWNSLISGYARHGWAHEALGCIDQMRSEGFSPDEVTFSSALKACGSIRSIHMGETIHDEIARRGLLSKSIVLGNALLDMYVKCGALTRARHAFDELPARDVVSWNALISGYAQNGESDEAFDHFERMQREGPSPDGVTFSYIIMASGNAGAISKGDEIYDEILARGLLENNIVLGNGLIDMYVRCGDLEKAKQVLNKLSRRDVISWTTLISGYAHHGWIHEASNCLRRMQKEGISPNEVTYLYILKVCGSTKDVRKGKQIHDDIAKRGWLKKNTALWNALVAMYVDCGSFSKAREVLEALPVRDIVTWNVLITGYNHQRKGHEAIECFERMQREGIDPDASTLSGILKACGITRDLRKGEEIHEEIVKNGLLENDGVLSTALVDMYASCGALVQARRVLGELPVQEISSWNALIAGYAEHERCDEALACFEGMKMEGLFPDSITYTSALKACSNAKCGRWGRRIHGEVAMDKGLLEKDIVLGSALVDMYARCGMLEKAREVHDELPRRDVVSWSALIAGYVEHGEGHAALNRLEAMQIEGILPNEVTLISIFKACGITGAIEKGEQILARTNVEGSDALRNALLDMYAKGGALRKARNLLEELPIRDAASWAPVIAGYANEGRSREALGCFEQMRREGIGPNPIAYAVALKACGDLRASGKGAEIHDGIVRSAILSIERDVVLGTALVGMYAKCGMLGKAEELHRGLAHRDAVSWATLISAYAEHEQAQKALRGFEQMKSEGVSPNEAVFACVLKACGNAGAVDTAKRIHDEIAEKGLLETDGALGTALLDAYVKCGLLAKAREVHSRIRARDVAAWNALIVGYAQHGHHHEALDCFRQMCAEQLAPDAATFVPLLAACARPGRLNEAQMHLDLMTRTYGISPSSEHYTCMIAAFGNCGRFGDAMSMIRMMPSPDDPAVWLALANACKRWGNVELGRLSFDKALQREGSIAWCQGQQIKKTRRKHLAP